MADTKPSTKPEADAIPEADAMPEGTATPAGSITTLAESIAVDSAAGTWRFSPPCGPVIGDVTDEVVVARAIPYAQAQRFARPEPVAPWTTPHHSTTPSPKAPQVPSPYTDKTLGGRSDRVGSDLPESEQCLNLTVTRPATYPTPATSPTQPLPVVVWIHGGAYVIGAGDDPHFDPAALVGEQQVVFVAINFRLGILGYLGDGSDARPANLGLLDQLSALRWVGENIAAFGGDPDSVTVIGQSAGGDAVAHLMATPNPHELFRRAIIQSAPLGLRHRRRRLVSWMFDRTADITAATKISSILLTQTEISRKALRFGLKAAMAFGTQYGLPPLPEESAITTWWERAAPHIDLLIGHNRDETHYFFSTHPSNPVLKAPVVDWCARRVISPIISHVVYARDDSAFAGRHARAGGRTYHYRIDWAAPGNKFGSCHTIELALLFGTREAWEGAWILDGASREDVERDGAALRELWGRFIRGEDLGDREPTSLTPIIGYRRVR